MKDKAETMLKEAQARCDSYDKIDRDAGFASPQEPDDLLWTAVLAIEAGMSQDDMTIVADGLALLIKMPEVSRRRP